jgi:predicted RNA-binding protein with RPS1 domain
MILKMDYKAGERIKFDVWQKETRTGKPMLSVKENTWAKEKNLQKDQPKEVTPTYRQGPKTNYRKRDDEDIPF